MIFHVIWNVSFSQTVLQVKVSFWHALNWCMGSKNFGTTG